MAQKCMECGGTRKRKDTNYAGLSLGQSNISIYNGRKRENALPGDATVDYLCYECASKRTLRCRKHGSLSGISFPRVGLAEQVLGVDAAGRMASLSLCSQCDAEDLAVAEKKAREDKEKAAQRLEEADEKYRKAQERRQKETERYRKFKKQKHDHWINKNKEEREQVIKEAMASKREDIKDFVRQSILSSVSRGEKFCTIQEFPVKEYTVSEFEELLEELSVMKYIDSREPDEDKEKYIEKYGILKELEENCIKEVCNELVNDSKISPGYRIQHVYTHVITGKASRSIPAIHVQNPVLAHQREVKDDARLYSNRWEITLF